MSAEVLRRAAALMRERAEAAAPGPWVAECMPNGFAPMVTSDGMAVAETFDKPNLNDAKHIASWHPAVALAVTDWLDSVAGAMTPPGEPVVDAGRHINEADEKHALTVARAYLAEATP